MNDFRQTLKTITILLSVMLQACASKGYNPYSKTHQSPNFSTRITESGLKHFEVKLLPNSNQSANEIKARLSRAPNRTHRDDSDKLERYLIKVAQSKLKESGFCREGYWVIDRNYFGRELYLRGECNEPSSNADRTRYPDTIKQW